MIDELKLDHLCRVFAIVVVFVFRGAYTKKLGVGLPTAILWIDSIFLLVMVLLSDFERHCVRQVVKEFDLILRFATKLIARLEPVLLFISLNVARLLHVSSRTVIGVDKIMVHFVAEYRPFLFVVFAAKFFRTTNLFHMQLSRQITVCLGVN